MSDDGIMLDVYFRHLTQRRMVLETPDGYRIFLSEESDRYIGSIELHHSDGTSDDVGPTLIWNAELKTLAVQMRAMLEDHRLLMAQSGRSPN